MNRLKTLRILAISEGISYISFGITMPLKYIMHWPGPNYVVGMVHGFLFLLYCISVLLFAIKNKSNLEFYILGWLSSLIPFGTFWFDAKYLKNSGHTETDLIDQL